MTSTELSSWTWSNLVFRKLLFPGDNSNLKTAFLKPRGVSPDTLAKWRLSCMVWMIIQILIRGLTFSNSDLFYRFTNWSVIMNWLSYTIFTIAHIMNKDFGKQAYVEPSAAEKEQRPYYLWAVATGFYEFFLTASLSVFLVFGSVEYPYLRMSGFFLDVPWFYDILGWGMHVIPQIL